MSDVIYNKTVFKRFFEKSDPRVKAWAENVLQKICSPGILPVFLDKEGEDFKSFWGVFTHLFALVVIYARQYNEIDTNKILFDIFIKERGLVTDTIVTESQMQYLFNNYVNEYKKRGRLEIISREGIILGELLRLIRYQNLDEFIFSLLMSRDSGWTLGYSSPTWNRTDTVTNIIKGYENSTSIETLSKYPLLNPTGVFLQNNISNEKEEIQVMTFTGNEMVGISSEIDKSKLIEINENLPYQISFKIKNTISSNTIASQESNLFFGVQIYDELKRPLSCIETTGTVESNSFVEGNDTVNFLNNDIFYEFRATISKKNRSFLEPVKLNFTKGRGLKLVEGAKYLSLYLVQDRSKLCSTVFVYDIKIKPLYLPFTQGYLGDKNIIASYYLNNSYSSETSVNRFIDKFLISYRNIFASQLIKEINQIKILFKIFSERKEYIEGATISIAGETLTTNVNGEAQLILYPGDYSYDISKDKFLPIEGSILSVTESPSVQTEFIQMEGDLYERKIVFSVKDNIENKPLQGALVTFNSQFFLTSADGTVSFLAFPDLYNYTVKLDRYYEVVKSVLILDDMIENVIMTFIPIFNVTFVVKYKGDPVQGTTVTFRQVQLNTNINGIAVFENVPAGTFPYTIEKIDWLPVNNTITIINQDETIDVIFNPVPTFTVDFKTYSQSYKGVKTILPGVQISFAGATKTSDTNGNVSFVVKQGSYNYSGTFNNHKSVSGSLVVTENLSKDLIFIENTYSVTFTVSGESGGVLAGALVVLNEGTRGTTDAQGKVSFDLNNGGYSYEVSRAEAHTETGSFTINNKNQDISVVMVTTTYQVIFIIRESGLVSVGATIKIDGFPSKSTGDLGQATFNLPRGTFNWLVSKTFYNSKSGSVSVGPSMQPIEVDLIRKTSIINFTVRDAETGSAIEGANVTCNNISRVTNNQGKISYDLPIGIYPWSVSKSPDYPPVYGNTNETEVAQEINVNLSSKTYNIIFTVKDEKGKPVFNATVNLEGSIVGSTDGNGQVSFRDKRNGRYSYTVSKTGFTSVQGSISVSSKDEPVSVQLNTKLSSVTLNLRKDGVAYSGASVKWRTNTPEGTFYASGTGYVATGPSEGRTWFSEIADSECLEPYAMEVPTSQGSQTVNIYKCLILGHSSQSTNVTTDFYASQEWSGNDLKVGTRNGSSFSFSANGTTNLTSIKQWPVSYSISGTAAFQSCRGLNSIASGSPRISGSISSWWRDCANLRNIPSGLLLNVTGSNASYCFRGSGVTSVPDNLFGSNLTIFTWVFGDCNNLVSVNGTPFNNGRTFESAFRNCGALTTLSPTTFQNCNMTDCPWIFAYSGISSFPSGLLSRGATNCINFTGFAQSCLNLRSIVSSLFYSTGGQNFSDSFLNCSLLSSVGSNVFPNSTTSMLSTFKNCISLIEIKNCIPKNGRVSSMANCFENTGITTIFSDQFQNMGYLKILSNTFRNCKQLQKMVVDSAGKSYFISGCPLTTVESLFAECPNFKGGVTSSNTNTVGQVWMGDWHKTCLNYSNFCINNKNMYSVVMVTAATLIWQAALSSASKTAAFRNCTKIPTYANIPTEWK